MSSTDSLIVSTKPTPETSSVLSQHLQRIAQAYAINSNESSKALFLENFGESEGVFSTLALRHLQKRPLLWITQNSEEQSLRMAQLQGLASCPLHFLPSMERETSQCSKATHSAQNALPGALTGASQNCALKAYASRELHQIAKTLANNTEAIILAESSTLVSQLPLLASLAQNTLEITEGIEIVPGELAQLLESMGYQSVALVEKHGEYCLKRDLLDVFDASALEPVRISFWGDEVEQLHTFHPQSQRTLSALSSLTLHRADLNLLNSKDTSQGATLLAQLPQTWSVLIDQPDLVEQQCVDLLESPAYQQVSSALKKRKLSFLSKYHLKELNTDAPANSSSFSWLNDTFPISRVLHQSVDPQIVFPIESNRQQTNEHLSTPSKYQEKHHFVLEKALEQNYALQIFYLTQAEKKRISRWFIERYCTSAPQENELAAALKNRGILLHQANLPNALCYTHEKILCMRFDAVDPGEKSLWRPTLRKEHSLKDSKVENFTAGDYVIHLKHGIGIYRGIDRRKTPGSSHESEFIRLEYEGNAQLWVPLNQANLLHPYESFDQIQPKIHKIGSTNWAKQLKQAKLSVEGYAKDLLELYARREMKEGFVCAADSPLFEEFEEDFPYTLSEDQAKAIEEIKKDLCHSRPMDRLLCGDVGFGKTEVAMRGACKTACDGGHQVAVLAPTTVLALQHYETFSSRMRQTPLCIELLTRMQKAKDKKRILEQLQRGEIDILIGTHRLLSDDVQFSRLGLVVVDEEHRFGVRAKEKLKKMKETVNYLSLSATPIPRTLHLSMMGAKEFSHINTAPDDRLPVATIVTPYSDSLIEKALKFETGRGGQAFFVHNNIDELYTLSSHFKKKMPYLKIAIVHGQMDAKAIEEIFHGFQRREIDLLMATTIIETGIDIANANTLFVYRAHHYGLSDLHQLRGRVGRWNRQAYAYFLTPSQTEISETAYERLNALQEHAYLGGGMQLAMRDLQIRGCGNILGQEQSGHVCNIGFSYYCQLLKETVKRLDQHKKQSPDGTALIPPIPFTWTLPQGINEQYVCEGAIRLDLHRRLGQAESESEINAIFEELIDRFGQISELEKAFQESLLLPFRLAKIFHHSVIPAKVVQSVSVKNPKEGAFVVEVLWHIAKKPPLLFPISPKELTLAEKRTSSRAIALSEVLLATLRKLIGTREEHKAEKIQSQHALERKEKLKIDLKKTLTITLKRALRSYSR